MARPHRLLVAGMGLAIWANTAIAIQPATVLKKMEKEWETIHSFHAQVIQTHYDPNGVAVAQYLGDLTVARPNRIRIDYREVAVGTPFDATVAGQFTHVIWTDDGEFLYEYDLLSNILSRDEFGGVSSVPFIEAVAGLNQFTAEGFAKEYWVTAPVPEETFGETAVYLLSAHPEKDYQDTRQPFDVWVGRADTIPRLIKLYLPQETLELSVKGFQVNPEFGPDHFNYLVPSDAIRNDRTGQD